MDKENKFNTERTRTMFLCAIAGFLGAHEFYQKKYFKGALFIFFGTLGLFSTSMPQLPFLIFCLPIVFLASFISQIRLVVNKKNTDAEFCLGIFFLCLSLVGLMFRPNVYNTSETVTIETKNSKTVKTKSFKL